MPAVRRRQGYQKLHGGFLLRSGRTGKFIWQLQLLFQEAAEPGGQLQGVFGLAFPDNECFPTEFRNKPKADCVAFFVLFQLWNPVALIRFWNPCDPASGIRVLMPKASVNKNDFLAARKDDVWVTRETFAVEAVSVSGLEQQATNFELRRHAFTPNSPHVLAAAFRGEVIQYSSSA